MTLPCKLPGCTARPRCGTRKVPALPNISPACAYGLRQPLSAPSLARPRSCGNNAVCTPDGIAGGLGGLINRALAARRSIRECWTPSISASANSRRQHQNRTGLGAATLEALQARRTCPERFYVAAPSAAAYGRYAGFAGNGRRRSLDCSRLPDWRNYAGSCADLARWPIRMTSTTSNGKSASHSLCAR